MKRQRRKSNPSKHGKARAIARALFSLHKHLYYSKLPFAVREVAHGEVYLGGFMDYAALVRKRIEAFFAVVAAHAAFPYAAERQRGGGKMDYGIVHAAPAEGAAFQQPALGCPVRREYIKRKRLWAAVNKGYNLA